MAWFGFVNLFYPVHEAYRHPVCNGGSWRIKWIFLAVGQALALIFPNRSGGACIRPDALQQFLREMKAEGLRRGMAWEGTVQTVELRSERSFEKELTETLQKYSPKFVFGIFDRGMDRQYAEFKTVMDHEHGIPSQGLLSATVLRNPRGCIENILYKVNVKNGGTSSAFCGRFLFLVPFTSRHQQHFNGRDVPIPGYAQTAFHGDGYQLVSW